MNWIGCDDWKMIPVGVWLVKIKKDRSPYHVAYVTENLITVGGYFHFDRGEIEAYTAFKEYESK